jgi:opacity protein-like surface antigen
MLIRKEIKMRKEVKYLMVTIVVLSGALDVPVYSRDPSGTSDGWSITNNPYIWFAGMDATMTVDGLSASADLSSSDVADITELSINSNVEAWKGKWGLLLGVGYTDLEDDVKGSFGPVNFRFDGTIRSLLADFAVAHRIYEQQVGQNEQQKLAIDPYAGFRYGYLKQEYKLNVNVGGHAAGTTLDGSEDYVEPFVGGRLIWDLSPKMSTGVRADVGGFGIGTASDLTWNVMAWVDYQITKRIAIRGGYRVLDIDYSRGSGLNKYGMDAQVDGPLVGLLIRW